MKLFIASDHAGFQLKSDLIKKMREYNDKFNDSEIELVDLGTDSDESCDYPIFANKLIENVLNASEKDRGILICGTGIGMSIAANRHLQIRAALCFNEGMAIMSRKHNDANVLVLGARIIDFDVAVQCVRAFLKTDFEGGRHARRLALMDECGKK